MENTPCITHDFSFSYDQVTDMVIIKGVNHASRYPGAITRGLIDVFP